MRKCCVFYLVTALFIFFPFSLSAVGESVFYRSNSLGMKLEKIQESEKDDYPWIIRASQTADAYEEVLLKDGIYEIWFETTTQVQGRRIVNRMFSDKTRTEQIFRDNLLIEMKETAPSGSETRKILSYFSGELLSIQLFEDSQLYETVTYIRRSDGSLHMRQVHIHDAGGSIIDEILIIDSDSQSRAILGKSADFSLIRSYSNGMIVSEKWISDEKIDSPVSVQEEVGGTLIVTKTDTDGTEIVTTYNSEGLREQETRKNPTGTTTTLYFYDDKNRVASRESVGKAGKTVTDYSYDSRGSLQSETDYLDGTIQRKLIYSLSGNREEIYREGKLYLSILYEADGKTVKDTQLAE
ncbi:MAG: hypothetical protein K9L21_01310 [Spirochaetia bacterium]|nr:hypothetical protein [Spirochaetia bacterium]